MATDNAIRPDRPPMTIAELVSYTKKELENDAERARLQASSAGVLPAESQAGTTLDLSNAKIQALPVEVLVLIKDRVERLALSHNRQISIPSQIVQCERLRYLNIRWNELIQFPRAILQLSNLEILDLSKNSITSIPEDINRLSSLRFLAISNNKVTRLPLAIGDMTNLGRLKVEDNPIEFPPPEVFKPPKDQIPRIDVSRSSDVCQNVKRFLKDTANKQKQKMASEDETSESNAETPRPPRRTATGGRFPIRPSISGIDNSPDARIDSPGESIPPPIPQRSHARIGSSASVTNISTTVRPTTAISAADRNDGHRHRSETASSTASLRQRRQGFVPSRKVTGDLTLVSETSSQASMRSSQASTVRPDHSRETSSASISNDPLRSVSNGYSPQLGGTIRPTRRRSGAYDAVESTKRLLFTLRRLQHPITDVTDTLVQGTLKRSLIENKSRSAQSVLRELDMLFHRLQNSLERGTTTNSEAMKAIVRISVRVLKSYSGVVGEVKRHIPAVVKSTDGFKIRSLMHQLYATTIEVQNVCTVLGFRIKDGGSNKETPRISQAWSSKSITPTQPKAPFNPRLRNGTPLQSANSPPPLRGAPPPTVPLNTNISRTNTMTSMSAATPRSGDTFQLHSPRPNTSHPLRCRSNTMRSMMDIGENDEQFERIFIKLKQACDLAGQALPHCRVEFNDRREQAQNSGQRGLSQQWTTALKKCDFVMTNNKALKKRLDMVKLNDPGVRYQRDFWLACDAFVHSWAELATVIKDLGTQRIDITASKQHMRSVQKVVRDASKMISHSPLYHHAIGIKGPDGTSLAPPFPAGLRDTYSSAGAPGAGSAQGNYVVGPATPLSAAIGPAAHSIQPPGGEYGQGRAVHERNDTVMQPGPRQGARRPQ